ncbi:MAG: putative ABC transport system permease protein, partial [Pseudohongiellaceae bacterium]
MRLRTQLTMMARESRGSRGRLLFFIACLAIGVGAVVAVSSTVAAIDDGMRAQARDLLAADMVISSRQPLPDALPRFLADLAPGHERTEIHELSTMAAAVEQDGEPGSARLVELKAIDGRFPFYGELTLEPAGVLGDLLNEGTVVVAPELLSALQLSVGDELLLGGEPFTIAGVVLAEPNRLAFSFSLGPRVFLSRAGLDRAGLLSFGSRVRYRTMVALAGKSSEGELVSFASELGEALRDGSPEPIDGLSIETWQDAQPAVRQQLDRARRFLGLVALLSLLLGGIGVAQIVRAWLAMRIEAVAVLRCLGFRSREILVLYLGHVAFLALAGSLLGAAIGGCFPLLLPHIAADLVPADLIEPWQPFVVLRGVLLGLGVALVFSLPALSAVFRVSPARVLRADAAPLPARWSVRVACVAVLLLGLFAAAWSQGGSALLAAAFTGGLVITAGALAAGARATMWLVGRLPRDGVPAVLRHGLSALTRPGAGTTGAVTALGLGVLVVMTMSLVAGRLEEEFAGALPASAPSAFMVDVQPDQWPGVKQLLEDSDASSVDSVPVVMARLSSVNGRAVRDMLSDPDPPPRWVLTREQRLTWREELQAETVLVAGELWADPSPNEVSLEESFAERLGVDVGDHIVFDVQGVPMKLLVTSLRRVEWRSFAINFFIVVEPGVLEEAPHFRIAAARLDELAEKTARDALVASYPNVTFISLRAIIETVMELLGTLALGVRLLGSFTILTGLVVLAGAIASTSLRRSQEAALLKTLGVTRRGVAALFAVEYALCGLVA